MRVSPPDPPLCDGAITLRPWNEADVPAITTACREDEIARWLVNLPQPYREADARAYVEQVRRGWSEGSQAAFAVVDSTVGEVLGSVGIRLDPEQAVAEVGYWVRRESRGRGIATRALRLISAWALGELGIARLQLRADVLNEPSNRVAQRAGYVREGVLRSSHYNAHQQRRVDFVLYSLLPEDLLKR